MEVDFEIFRAGHSPVGGGSDVSIDNSPAGESLDNLSLDGPNESGLSDVRQYISSFFHHKVISREWSLEDIKTVIRELHDGTSLDSMDALQSYWEDSFFL